MMSMVRFGGCEMVDGLEKNAALKVGSGRVQRGALSAVSPFRVLIEVYLLMQPDPSHRSHCLEHACQWLVPGLSTYAHTCTVHSTRCNAPTPTNQPTDIVY